MSESFEDAMDTLERESDQSGAVLRRVPRRSSRSAAPRSRRSARCSAARRSRRATRVAARLDELQFDLGEGPVLGCDAIRAARCSRPTSAAERRHGGRRSPQSVVERRGQFGLRLPARRRAAPLRRRRPVLRAPVSTSSDTQTQQAGAMADVVSRHVLRRALSAIGGDDERGAAARSRAGSSTRRPVSCSPRSTSRPTTPGSSSRATRSRRAGR